jgi:hypothetical protein
MAPHFKKALDYFPKELDMFEDPKLKWVEMKFGFSGCGIVIKLLDQIYREGYFLRIGEDFALMLACAACDKGRAAMVSSVIEGLVAKGFFDKGIYDSRRILTSIGIQKRFIEATGRRAQVVIDPSIWLIFVPKNAVILDPEGIMSTLTPLMSTESAIMSTLIPRAKKSKAKYLRECGETAHTQTTPTPDEVKAFCAERGSAIDPAYFVDYYAASGWLDKEGKPFDWRQKIMSWEKIERPKEEKKPSGNKFANFEQRDYDYAAIEKAAREKLMEDGF